MTLDDTDRNFGLSKDRPRTEAPPARGMSRYRLGFCGAPIVAAAFEADGRRLYGEDMPDGQRTGQPTIINPFRDS